MLTNNETKDILKVVRSFRNRGTLLKETTRKITSQEGRFLNFLRRLMPASLPLMRNIVTPSDTNVLMPLGLTAAALVTHASIKKNIFGSNMTTLIFSNEELNDVMKLVKSLEYKNKKEDF